MPFLASSEHYYMQSEINTPTHRLKLCLPQRRPAALWEIHTRAYHNCSLKDFTHQLIKTDKETHRQTLDGALEHLWKSWEKDSGPWWIKDSKGKPTRTTNMVHWKLSTTDHQPNSIKKLHQDIWHICSKCASQSQCVCPNMWNRVYS